MTSQVVFDDDHRRAVCNQRPKYAEQGLHVQRVQPDGRLVKHEHRIRLRFPHLAGQLQALRLAARKARRRFAQRQIAEPELL